MVFNIQRDDQCYKCEAIVRFNGRIVSMECEPLGSCDVGLPTEYEIIRKGYFGTFIRL